MSAEFITSYGHKIDIMSGYKASHPQATAAEILYQTTDPNYIVSEYQFIKDYFEFLLVDDFLSEAGQTQKFGSMLDLGGEEGCIARLFKYTDRAERSYCIDFRDLRHCLPTKLFMDYCQQVELDRQLLIKGATKSSRILHHFAALSREFNYNPYLRQSLYQHGFSGSPELDGYLCEDFFELKQKYDLITACLCLSWFDLHRLLKKASECLNTGGIFFFICDYWWWPVNSTCIVGDFPYACQRLNSYDFNRYLDQFMPDQKEDVLKRYNYYHLGKIRPTISDYINVASGYGLKLSRAERIMPTTDTAARTPYAPTLLQRNYPGVLSEVLRDIKMFRPDVNYEDLLTSFVAMAFQKD